MARFIGAAEAVVQSADDGAASNVPHHGIGRRIDVRVPGADEEPARFRRFVGCASVVYAAGGQQRRERLEEDSKLDFLIYVDCNSGTDVRLKCLQYMEIVPILFHIINVYKI